VPSLDKHMFVEDIVDESIGDHNVNLENTIAEMKRVSKAEFKFQETCL
jgi:hypothetical protein